MSRQRWADAALLLTAVIWGSTFVMVKGAIESYPVFPFLALRFALASVAILPLYLFRPTRRILSGSQSSVPASRRRDLKAGIFIGSLLFCGFATQTLGLRYTTPAKSGFITGLAVVMVPMMAWWVLRQPLSRSALAGVLLAALGLAFLSFNSNGSVLIGYGDLLTLVCAFFFAAHIVAIAHFAPTSNPLRLTWIQVVVVAIGSTLAAWLLGEWRIGLPSASVWGAATFTGVLATALAFGLQTSAQRYTTASHTALILTGEPVFAALFSYLLIGERLGSRALLGCLLILLGMVAVELRSSGQHPPPESAESSGISVFGQ